MTETADVVPHFRESVFIQIPDNISNALRKDMLRALMAWTTLIEKGIDWKTAKIVEAPKELVLKWNASGRHPHLELVDEFFTDALAELIGGASQNASQEVVARPLEARTFDIPEKRQDTLVAVHNALESAASDHQVTVNLMRDTAKAMRERADEMDQMALEIEDNMRQAALATTNALKYERKAYAELLEVRDGLERTVARVSS